MSSKNRYTTISIAVGLFLIGSMVSARGAELKLDPKLLDRGKVVFQRECVVCHGLSGQGDGEAAYLLHPQPRDFTSQKFKIRTTGEGEPPTRGDLIRTISEGMPGSTMPSYRSLPEGDQRALAEYVLSLAKFEQEPAQTLKIPKVPPQSKALIAKGKTLYQEFECGECHGPKGDGKVVGADSLKDHKKRPIRPNDFTRGVFKGGSDPQSVMTRFMTGMDGTPMPSFLEAGTQEQLIALTQYVMSLSRGRSFKQPSTGTISALRVTGKLPVGPNESQWQTIAPTRVPMMLLYNDGRLPQPVMVRAAHDEKSLSILLEWTDKTRNTQTASTTGFADSAAVQFSLQEKNPPLFAMGSGGNMVNIWYWTAGIGRRMVGVEAKYPGMAVDDYPFSGRVYPRRAMGHPKVPPARTTKSPFITAWAAGNPNSTPGRARSVMDLNAAGFGTLQPQGPEGQNVTGSSRWARGRWRVVLTRTLKSNDEGDAQLAPGKSHPIAFATWDGSRRDRNGQKAVSTWYRLLIK